MKLFRGSLMAAGMVLTASAAHAQMLVPYEGRPPFGVVSDFEGPYMEIPREAPPPPYGGPILLPPAEVYALVRESGLSPLGIPLLRGFVYTISVIDRGGADGRLLIDARSGRIIRFMPAYRMGDNAADMARIYGRAPAPPVGAFRGPPRPPGVEPHLASRAVPIPRGSPLHGGEAKPVAARPAPEPAQHSAAAQTKPGNVQAAAPAAAAPAAAVPARPAAPTIQPTQEMPKVQGLE